MKGFKNVKAFIDGEFKNISVGFIDDQIKYVGDNESVITEEIKIDGILCPGFIDQHIHGADGVDFMEGDIDRLHKMSKCLVKEGVTSFAPTTVTFDVEQTITSVKVAKQFSLKSCTDSARVIGVHLEGPFIDFSKKGAQNPNYIIAPDIDVVDKVLDAGDGIVKIISLAPEVAGMEGFIKHLVDRGITISAGHTNASYSQFKSGVEWGITCATHTFNAMSAFNHRDIGVAGGSMVLDVYNEIIPDGVHVSFDAIKILATLKQNKLILVTDSLSPKGMSFSTKNYETDLGGLKVIVDDTAIRLESGTLAGSILTMNRAVKNMVNSVGLPVEVAIKSATENPAKNLKVFDKVGSITVGKKADFVVLDSDFNVKMTIVDGKIVYLA